MMTTITIKINNCNYSFQIFFYKYHITVTLPLYLRWYHVSVTSKTAISRKSRKKCQKNLSCSTEFYV